MLDVAPSIDLAKHRTKTGLGDAQPLIQGVDGTSSKIGVSGQPESLPRTIPIDPQVTARVGFAHCLDVKLDKSDAAEAGRLH